MKAHGAKRGVVVAAVGLVLGGCATTTVRLYDGPDLSLDKVAAIECASLYYVLGWKNVYIREVDGRKNVLEGGQTTSITKAELLPGKHTMRVCAAGVTVGGENYSVQPQGVSFAVEAGRFYKLKVHVGPVVRRHPHANPRLGWTERDGRFWVEDTSTGEVVGGEKPN